MDKINPNIARIFKACKRIKPYIKHTPLQYSHSLSQLYQATILFKRQDLQSIRCFKIRGSCNLIQLLSPQDRKKGIVTYSAGNHAQGVAYCCKQFKIKGYIFMPLSTPQMKIQNVKFWGKQWIQIILAGEQIRVAKIKAQQYIKQNGCIYIPPFDHIDIIQGQGTIGLQIIQDYNQNEEISYLFCPIGGGGLISGISTIFSIISPQTKIIGCEPQGSPSMYNSLIQNKPINLQKIKTFVDSASVNNTGKITYVINIDRIKVELIPEGMICKALVDLFDNEGIIVELAGALSVSCLQKYKQEIKNKVVVCIISGSNNDIVRLPEIQMRNKIYQCKEKYYLIYFNQIRGSIKLFIEKCLDDEDDLIYMKSTKRNRPQTGPMIVGIEFGKKNNYKNLIQNLQLLKITYKQVLPDQQLFKLLI